MFDKRLGVMLAIAISVAGCGRGGSTPPEDTTAPRAEPTAAGASGNCVDPDERPLALAGRFWFNPTKSSQGPSNTPRASTIEISEQDNQITLRENGSGSFTYIDISGTVSPIRFEGEDRRALTATITSASPDNVPDALGRTVTLTNATISARFEPTDQYPQAKKCMYTGSMTGGGVLHITSNGAGVKREPDNKDADIVLLKHLELGRG